jgi:hypothetical protein
VSLQDIASDLVEALNIVRDLKREEVIFTAERDALLKRVAELEASVSVQLLHGQLEQVEKWKAMAEELGDVLEHCRGCRKCGDGPCCEHCGSDKALAKLEAMRGGK